MFAIPASAHDQIFHVRNNTHLFLDPPGFDEAMAIAAVTLTGAPPFYFSPPITQGHTGTFKYFNFRDQPHAVCLRWVTIYPVGHTFKPFTAPTKFNVCKQTTITVYDNPDRTLRALAVSLFVVSFN